ncbi:MAG: invasion associated locus B family protein [Alphaproteobacteria bacterium]
MSIKIMQIKQLSILSVFIIIFSYFPGQKLFSKELAKFNDWTAFAEGEGKNLACMAVSKPKKLEGDYSKRGDVFAIVTHLPGQKKWNEFSVVAGYNYKTNSNPDIFIDQKKFQLFTSGSRAWSFSPSDDEKIIKFLKKSMKMKVVGTSSRGTITSDTFSLMGFSKAYQKINQACKKDK